MGEDIERVKRILNENNDYIFEFDSGEEHICIRDVLGIIQEYEQENNNLKEASIINDRLYQEVCNKNKELEEEKKKLKEKVIMLDEAYSGAIKESKKWFDKAYNSIPKSLIKEKIEPIITDLNNNGFTGYADRLTEFVQELGG